MPESSVGIRELKANLSKYLRRVKSGRTVLITDRGKPVGRIVPVEQPLEERLRSMMEAGLLVWSGNKLEPMGPLGSVRGERTVADLLIDDRE